MQFAGNRVVYNGTGMSPTRPAAGDMVRVTASGYYNQTRLREVDAETSLFFPTNGFEMDRIEVLYTPPDMAASTGQMHFYLQFLLTFRRVSDQTASVQSNGAFWVGSCQGGALFPVAVNGISAGRGSGAVPLNIAAEINVTMTVTVGGNRAAVTFQTCVIEYLRTPGPPPSGSSSFRQNLALRRCPNCSADNPLPVQLTFELGTKVASGTLFGSNAIHGPTQLLHSADPSSPCSWISRSVAIDPDGGIPGLWILDKIDKSTWDLSLYHGKKVIVQYIARTNAQKMCAFPVTLNLEAAGKEFKKWPKTVKIRPAL
jgi:hypothetical protein